MNQQTVSETALKNIRHNAPIHTALARLDEQINITWGPSSFDHPYVRGLREKRDALVQRLLPIT